jgi:hypothetical protein
MYAERELDANGFLKRTLERMMKTLCIPEYSQSLGVMNEKNSCPDVLKRTHCWAGMTMEATGFAGMTLAENIKPGILYLI